MRPAGRRPTARGRYCGRPRRPAGPNRRWRGRSLARRRRRAALRWRSTSRQSFCSGDVTADPQGLLARPSQEQRVGPVREGRLATRTVRQVIAVTDASPRRGEAHVLRRATVEILVTIGRPAALPAVVTDLGLLEESVALHHSADRSDGHRQWCWRHTNRRGCRLERVFRDSDVVSEYWRLGNDRGEGEDCEQQGTLHG
jgi:hypothetical protein